MISSIHQLIHNCNNQGLINHLSRSAKYQLVALYCNLNHGELGRTIKGEIGSIVGWSNKTKELDRGGGLIIICKHAAQPTRGLYCLIYKNNLHARNQFVKIGLSPVEPELWLILYRVYIRRFV